MNDQEITILKQSVGADPKIKRNSGLFSFLRWFKSTSRESVNSDVQNSTSGSSGSTDSLNSTGTVASFSYITPTDYINNKVNDNKCITPGPETDTYKARLKQRDKVRERDRNITLRKKYNLFFNRETVLKPKIEEEDDNSKSLPLMTRKMEEERGHRRTNSDSSKNKKAGAYVHVKGKRKAPQPPKTQESTLSLRRKKRLAPQPPAISTEKIINTLHKTDNVIIYADADVLFNDTLKLDHGILKSTNKADANNLAQRLTINSPNISARASVVDPQVSPRPWYKRNTSKSENKYEPVDTPESKFNKELKIDKKEEKRKSGLMFLTNISELDREASEIIKKEHDKHKPGLEEMPEFMKPKEHSIGDSLVSPKRKSAKDLIAKFNAITNVTKVTVNSAFFGSRETTVLQKEKRDYFGRNLDDKDLRNKQRLTAPLQKSETSACIIKPATPNAERKSWHCPKCNLENDYWRIICHVCASIKPYFDDLTTQPPKNNPIEKNVTENNAIKLTTGVGAYNSKNTEHIVATNNLKLEKFNLERSKTQIGFSAVANLNKSGDNKREEREKLKKMLIEMKNSLPKRKSGAAAIQNRKSTIDESPELTEKKKSDPNLDKEDIKLQEFEKNSDKKMEEVKLIRPTKVSSSVQTSAIVKKNADSPEARKNFQLMRPKDFDDIYSAKSGNPTITHLYANLAQNENLFLNVPKRFSDIKNGMVDNNNQDTLEINRLLRRLESAIAKGDLTDAAVYARELAQLKINCSVIRQKSIEHNEDIGKKGAFMVEMYVEDRLSHRGPFPIQVHKTQTVLELKKQVEREFEIPVAVQRWILGKELASSEVATLNDHNVTTNGCPIFLYLVAPTTSNSNGPKQINIEVDQKEMNTASTSVDYAIFSERKLVNIQTPPRIVEEKFKPIEKIIDQKSKEILKISEKVESYAPKFITTDLQKQTKSAEKELDLIKPTTSSSGLLKPKVELEIKQPPRAEEEDFTEYDKTLRPQNRNWECKMCTLLNPLTVNICSVCGTIRLKDVLPIQNKKMQAPNSPKTKHYLELMNLDNSDLVHNVEPFECLVCFIEIPTGEGITLRECLHQFCRGCLANTIQFCDEAEIKCPFRDEQYSCDIALQDREIKALVTPAIYDQFLAKSVAQAENKMGKSFHCKTPDCKGWCVFEDNVNEFKCPVCRKTNCLTCQAIHHGINCRQYQERMNIQSETDESAKQTKAMLDDMVNKGEALTCPACQVILMKKWGCDWVRCSMCKTEICWVTRGLRWGPTGKGDTSGGCKCGVNGIKCHPQCNYCH